jgi:hypothetical protein
MSQVIGNILYAASSFKLVYSNGVAERISTLLIIRR